MKQPMITKPSVSGTHFSKPATTFNAIGPLPPPTPPPPSFAALSHTAAKNKIVTQTESPRSVAIIECFRDIEIGYVAYRAARARAHLGLQQNYLTVAEVVSDTLATIALKSHKHTEPTNEPITTTTTTSTTSPATTNILVSLSKNTTVGVASVNPIPVARVAPRVHRAIEEREEGEEEEEDDVGIDISIPTVNTAASVQSIPGSAPGSAPGSYSIPKAYPSHPSHPSPNPNPPRAPPGQHHQHPLSRVAPPLPGKSHSHAQSGYPPRPLPPRFVPSDYNQSFKR